MNIHQTKDTLSVAEAVKKVLAPDVQLEKKISETEIAPADKAAHDDHVVDKKKNPESEKQTEENIKEDVTDFRGFKSKDKLVKFTSMAKKLKIKPVGNPIIMKRMGTDYHVQGFSGKVRDIEKSIKVAVEIEKGTIESVDFTKEGNEFTAAAAKAKLAGKDEFEFDGKKYPVEIEQDAAEKILGKKESVEISEDVDNFFGFKSKDKLVQFQSMAKKLKIKPSGNPTIMKRMGTDYHVMPFSGKVKDIEKAIRVAVEVEKGTAESAEIEEGFLDKVKDKINPKKAKAREALAKMAKTKEKLQAAKDKFLDKAKNATNRINDIENNAGDYEDPDQEIQDIRDIAGSHRFDAEEVQKKIDSISNKMSEISKKFGVRAPKNESVEESVELQEAADFGDIEKVMKWAKKNIVGNAGTFPQLDISKKYGTAFINLTIFNIIVLRLGGKKGIVVTHDDRKKGKGKDYEKHFSSANDVIKFVQKIYDEMPKDESVEVEESADLEEALKPADFVKGGDAKVTKRDVDGMLSKIFINTKLAKQVEDSEAYQAGEKGKGKKKNPYKKDTADFQLYELGVQSSQAS